MISYLEVPFDSLMPRFSPDVKLCMSELSEVFQRSHHVQTSVICNVSVQRPSVQACFCVCQDLYILPDGLLTETLAEYDAPEVTV